MNNNNPELTLEELVSHVKTFGTRKQFQPGDVVVCTVQPYGQKSPVPGDRLVVVEPCSLYPVHDGTPMAAGELGDHVMARVEPRHEQGYVTHTNNSRFFVLEADYTKPTTNTEN